MERKLHHWQKWIARISGIALALLIWKLLAVRLGPFKLPPPEKLLPAMVKYLTANPILQLQGGGDRGIWPHLLYTFERTLIGSAVGIALGILFGLLVGYSQRFRLLMDAPIEMMRTIPPLAAIPFFLLWFGPTQTAQLAMMIFYCFFMLLINTVSAIDNVAPVYLKYASTLGASKAQVYRTVVLPAILPELVGGIRVVIGVSWGIQIVTELMGAQKGMGQVFSMVVPMQALDVIIVSVLWITLLAAATDIAFVRLARIVTRWTPAQR